jgi:hypothetical protein
MALAGQPARGRGTWRAGEASWADLARAVFARAGMATRVRPIATADYPTRARRRTRGWIAGRWLCAIGAMGWRR